MLRAQALQFAKIYKDEHFTASNGWLEALRKRHAINFNTVCGETRDVDESVVTNLLQKIPAITEGYDPKDIANCDETVLFYRAIPQKSLSFKGEKCSGGKLQKERLSVLLCALADGIMEKPLEASLL